MIFIRSLLSLRLPLRSSQGEEQMSPSSNSEPLWHNRYGATASNHSSFSGSQSPTRLNRVPEETTDADEQAEVITALDLEGQGYFIGSYERFLALYTLVPLTSIVAFILLALTPTVFFPTQSSRPHPNYFPTPVPEVLTSAGLWSLSHLLRFQLFSLTSSLLTNSKAATMLHTAIHVLTYNFLRLSILPILSIRQGMEFSLPTYLDYAFRRIWWTAVGWSIAEVGAAIWQGYEQVALYKEVMIPEWRVKEMSLLGGNIDQELGVGGGSFELDNSTAHPQMIARSVEDAMRSALNHDLDRLVAIKSREELEEVYGVPVIRIPVFITCLQRIDSIILSLGLTLLTSASYLGSAISLSRADTLYSSSATFWIVFPLVVIGHFCLMSLYTPTVLPRIGMHTAAYIGILFGLGALFAGLAMWDVLS